MPPCPSLRTVGGISRGQETPCPAIEANQAVALIAAWLGLSMPGQAFSPLVAGREVSDLSPDGNRFRPEPRAMWSTGQALQSPAVKGGRVSLPE